MGHSKDTSRRRRAGSAAAAAAAASSTACWLSLTSLALVTLLQMAVPATASPFGPLTAERFGRSSLPRHMRQVRRDEIGWRPPLLDPRSVSPQPRRPSAATNSKLAKCLSNAGLSTVTRDQNSTDAFWDAAQSDNLVFHFAPAAITYPRDTKDVQAAVKCAVAEGNIAVAARSGGHSFGGFGSGGQDGSLVIDLKALDHIESNVKEEWADVGPGARLGDVVKALWADGKRAMPHGTCPSVGVGGHALCGGFGPMSRQWGLTADVILEAEVVLADGRVSMARVSENPKLLWGLKGAGAFFGIVTRFRFRTFPADGKYTFLEYRWGPSLKSVDDVVHIVSAVQDFSLDKSQFPKELGFHVQVTQPQTNDPPGTVLSVHLRGMYAGPADQYEKVIDKLFDRIRRVAAPTPDKSDVHDASYLHLMEEWDDFGATGHKLDTAAEAAMHDKFVARTTLSRGDKNGAIDSEHLRAPLKLAWDLAHAHTGEGRWAWNIFLEMFGGANAQHLTADKARAGAFPHRDALWLIQSTVGTWPMGEIDAEGFALMHSMDGEWTNAVRASGATPSSYSCYVDPTLPNWKTMYYGDTHNIEKLEKLKARLDPTNLFRNPHSLAVPPPPGSKVQFDKSVHPLP